MPSSLNGTGVTFNDGTTLNSANDAGGNYIQQKYTSPATWTKPAGLKAIRISMLAAGGGGGGVTASSPGEGVIRSGGAGGPSREISIGYLAAASIPGPVSVTIGSGGAGGTTSGTAGGAGGTSSFGPFMSMTGGGGGGGRTAPTTGQASLGLFGGVATGPAVTLANYGGAARAERSNVFSNTGLLVERGSSYGLQGLQRSRTGGPTPSPLLPAVESEGFGAGGRAGISDAAVPALLPADAGGAGRPGIIIIEEFY